MKIALTGHRHERLGFDNNLNHPCWYPIIDWMKLKIQEYEVTDVYSGMAEGCDMAFALAAIKIKQYGYPLKLHCVLPCKNYQSSHSLYDYIKNRADEWIELSDEFYKGCDNVRDQYMVDHCDVLLAIWDGNKSGGVWSTIRKAQKAGKTIIYCPKEILER